MSTEILVELQKQQKNTQPAGGAYGSPAAGLAPESRNVRQKR